MLENFPFIVGKEIGDLAESLVLAESVGNLRFLKIRFILKPLEDLIGKRLWIFILKLSIRYFFFRYAEHITVQTARIQLHRVLE